MCLGRADPDPDPEPEPGPGPEADMDMDMDTEATDAGVVAEVEGRPPVFSVFSFSVVLVWGDRSSDSETLRERVVPVEGDDFTRDATSAEATRERVELDAVRTLDEDGTGPGPLSSPLLVVGLSGRGFSSNESVRFS